MVARRLLGSIHVGGVRRAVAVGFDLVGWSALVHALMVPKSSQAYSLIVERASASDAGDDDASALARSAAVRVLITLPVLSYLVVSHRPGAVDVDRGVDLATVGVEVVDRGVLVVGRGWRGGGRGRVSAWLDRDGRSRYVGLIHPAAEVGSMLTGPPANVVSGTW